MPARNSTKQYLENGYYHIYNRGINKMPIFLDEQDYSVFLSYLKEYLLPKNEKELYDRLSNPDIPSKEKDKILKLLLMKNFYEEITLLSYCLMINHFHFMIKQQSRNSIDKFIKSLCGRYAMYFNKKYKRVGPMYQGVYKAVLIENEGYYLYLTKYIHKQSLASQGDNLQDQPSSYADYLGARNTKWLKPDEILSYFSKTNANLSYQSFIKEYDDFSSIKHLIIEED